MQLAIDRDPKHAAKTKALRAEWAVTAMYVQLMEIQDPVHVVCSQGTSQ